ncbi:MAG: hypothetical protein ACRD6X_09775 [Pyrinomonadaceae bacterium]
MKRWIFWSFVSVATFLVGTVLVYAYLTLTAPIFTAERVVENSVEIKAVEVDAKETNEFVPEFRDLDDYEILDYPEFPDNFIDLHNSGSLLRRSEMVGKNGQKWLVMTEVNDRYAIRPSVAKVRQLKSISYVGDENDARISFGLPGNPIFAFRGIANVKPGKVTTVYLRPTYDEIDRRNLPIEAMKTGFKRELNLHENWYTLRVSLGQTINGVTVGVLVLENNGVQQVVARNYGEPKWGTIIGDLLWAGDIDNDGKLDLYFDEFNEKGYFSGGLYLSSHSKGKELVRLVGLFGYAGC